MNENFNKFVQKYRLLPKYQIFFPQPHNALRTASHMVKASFYCK